MVGKPGQYQFSFNAGELAPAVWGNTGLKQFYAGAAAMQNTEPVPQGGFRLMARSRWRAYLPLVYDPDTGEPAVRCMDFTYARYTAAYMVVLVPTQALIFKNGALMATLTTPYQAADLKFVKRVQRFDTMFLHHPSYPTGRILRNGSDTNWSFDQPPFTNIPQVALSGTYTNAVIETWTILIEWPATVDNEPFSPAGTHFSISVDGQATNQLYIGGGGNLDTQIQTAINMLPTVDPTVVVVEQTAQETGQSYQFEVQFSGGTNAGANFVVEATVFDNEYVAITTYRETIGIPGGEPLWSTSAGYAACGHFYQDRLCLGGFQSKASAFALSQTAEYFNFNIRVPSAASSAILLNLDTDGAESIVEMIASKHLVILTSEADYYVSNRDVSASSAPDIVQNSTYGCSNRVTVVRQESGLIYANREETIVYAATYDAVSDAYVSTPLSLLSSHLMVGLREAALQKSHVGTDPERYWLVRDDGLLIVGQLIRNQEVTAFTRWVTDGQVQAVAVDGDNMVHIAVTRDVLGQPMLMLETIEDGLWLDGAVTVTNVQPSAQVTGLGMHEGAQVWAVNDGYIEGPYVVEGGALTLEEPGSVVTVGRWTPPLVTTLPLVRDVAAHMVLKRPARVHTVIADVIGTTSLAIGANGLPAKDVVLTTVAQPTDQPIVPVSEQVKRSGLVGWSPEGQVTMTQVRPGALQVRDLVVSAKI